jgi:hypothetical protein
MGLIGCKHHIAMAHALLKPTWGTTSGPASKTSPGCRPGSTSRTAPMVGTTWCRVCPRGCRTYTWDRHGTVKNSSPGGRGALSPARSDARNRPPASRARRNQHAGGDPTITPEVVRALHPIDHSSPMTCHAQGARRRPLPPSFNPNQTGARAVRKLLAFRFGSHDRAHAAPRGSARTH